MKWRALVAGVALYLIALHGFGVGALRAQDNYEIQVYGSDMVESGHTMVELHNNFTIDGSKTWGDTADRG
jgi:hypothetical protein